MPFFYLLIFLVVNVSYAQVPFIKQNIAYQVISGELRALDITTGTYGPNLIAPIAGNPNPFTKLNGGDYNDVDDYIYVFQRASSAEAGIDPNHLIRIGSDGVVQDLGGSTYSLASSGTIIEGDWWGSNGSRLYCIRNISMLTPDPSRTLNVEEYVLSVGSVLDLSGVVKDGKTYLISMLKTRVMRRFDVTDPGNIITTDFSISSMPTGSYGAGWTDERDRVFVCHNSSGQIYLLEDYETSSPNPVLVMTGASTSTNDGMSSHATNPFGVPLPITLLGFHGTTENSKAHLNWSVEDMIDFSHFEIEKSRDAIKFNTVAKVEAYSERTDYTFTDGEIVKGTTYYRLKMVDLDGRIKYSAIIAVQLNEGGSSLLNLGPNPVTDILTVESETPATIHLLNPMGQKLFRTDLKSNEPSSIDVKALPNGIYWMQVIHNGSIVQSYKVSVHK
jgi:hypothetical protein